MADILDEKITIPSSEARSPLNFEVDKVVKKRDERRTYSSQERHVFKIETHPAFSAGTYTLRDIIDRLSKCAHLHDKTIFTGSLPQSSADCDCDCNCSGGGDDSF